MDDAEKAVKGLKCCSPHEGEHCKDCPYNDEFDCTAGMSQDALDLIESQQAEIERLKKDLAFHKERGDRGWDNLRACLAEKEQDS